MTYNLMLNDPSAGADRYRLRIKDPSGAEFEAEGSPEFIRSEKETFLESLGTTKIAHSGRIDHDQTKPGAGTAFWDEIVEVKGELTRLRLKSPAITAAEAALILLAAAGNALNRQEDLSAITLSKALKTSGYEPDRLDRLLLKEIREGRITASGTKRNRTYRITQKGLQKAGTAIDKINKAQQ